MKHNIKTVMAKSNIFYRIKNVFRWLPIIWRDRQFDHHFIHEIYIKKLEFTRDFFLSDDAMTESARETAKEIDEVIQLMKKTRDPYQNYEVPVIEYMEKKWGKIRKTLKKIDKENFEKIIHQEYNLSDSEQERYNNEYRERITRAQEKCIAERIEAYTLLAKRIDRWWD